ncbi:hypothetical protein A3715_10120 [Oleiphilus sp. HI0009]|uniref:DUF2069 domain-containing protein n=1 Tax=unclassified Oleiphilus TaxID=2631174 RepID=UPI0007C216F4|nr:MULTISPECIES: DUF2069 domain-containing protein [unclassified Oleiphilus]KZX78614.1 hypothetical protein A3715_10120 [Oleiphilus sp. HI0009]MCH2158466.1 DUF2069 domain-containing protein [Oleiphilaceae bacterium]KZY66756.1 hypothetical protein A3738_00530 [Oleiphilus sp. HI0066]KZY70219.1 hypothetical protein A3739_07025 [Oleiphilus sp. HI0067]KZZ55332.1 hypothetical protein A3762_21820 [Oleiphilus sp. HI0125]
MTNSLELKSKRAALVTKISYVALLVILAYTTFVPGLPEGVSVALVLAVKYIPLLIVLPGLLLNKLRSYVWLCFIVLFYFTRAFVDAYMQESWLSADTFITVITMVLFLAAMYFVKWEKLQGKSL